MAPASHNDDQLFDEPLLERHLTTMPPDYLREAPGALFAGRKILRHAGCVAGKHSPSGWLKPQTGSGHKPWGEYVLQTRQCGDCRSRRWTLERAHYIRGELEALVFAFQSVPIWGHSCREAMFLVEFFQHDHALRLVGASWKHVYQA